ncbi:MAG: 16S rRNA (cytidine(1402)-2'-O)-methyltransferase [Armatimonadetes bacterium]|nr:16S rRNA (cytidine(1402)-2'-O)-methyltransferase [Armatimonadota bacterium]
MNDAESGAPEGSTTGALYIVGTPIGNLEDVTLRALRVLKEVDLIAAEDTRVTRKLLSHFEIHTPLTSYHQHTGGGKTDSLVDRIAEGERIALVSDAGMPGVSDPGSDLIERCIARGLPVHPVPGPTAVTAALAASGLSTQRFAFDGFPPRQRKNRVTFFNRLRDEARTVVLYESPRRLCDTLTDLEAVVGAERQIVVAREITKLYETFIRGNIEQVRRRFEAEPPRGECVILLAGAAPEERPPVDLERVEVPEGISTRDLTERLMAEGMPRKEAYRAALRLRNAGCEGEKEE